MLRDDSIVRRAPGPSLDQLLPAPERGSEALRFVQEHDSPEKFVLMVSGSPGDAQRYRCTNKLEEFAYLGLTADSVTSQEFQYRRDLDKYEMFLLHRVENTRPLEDFIQQAKALGKPVVFDTDDLV